MTIKEAQQVIDQWINTTGVRYFSELTNMAILTEEVGELARIVARKYGDQSFKEGVENQSLSDELADVLFVLLCIANQTGVDMTYPNQYPHFSQTAPQVKPPPKAVRMMLSPLFSCFS